MKLPTTAHTSRPWRIHDLAPDFHLEDVWALPTPGGPADLPRLVAQWASTDFPRGAPLVVRALWAARWKIGALLGWDRREAGLGARVKSLRNRLPLDLPNASRGPDFGPFTSLYLLENEWAAEMANGTVHSILHLGWVPDESGGYRAQMAVLVKPNGRLGAAYMAAIKPLRRLFVYPALIRDIEHGWRGQQSKRAQAWKPLDEHHPIEGPCEDRDYEARWQTATIAKTIGARASKAAGWLAIAFGCVHVVVAPLDQRHIWSQVVADGLWNTFTLEPTTLSQIQRSEAFWVTVGSFGVPMLAFGCYVVWSTRQHRRVPGWIGWMVLAWGLFFVTVLPASPGWVVPIIGGLIVLGDRL